MKTEFEDQEDAHSPDAGKNTRVFSSFEKDHFPVGVPIPMEKAPTHRECFAGGLSLLIWFMSVTIGEPDPLVQIFVNAVTCRLPKEPSFWMSLKRHI